MKMRFSTMIVLAVVAAVMAALACRAQDLHPAEIQFLRGLLRGSVPFAQTVPALTAQGVVTAGSTVAVDGKMLALSTNAFVYAGKQTTRAAMTNACAAAPIGSLYVSTAGKVYVRVAAANDTNDWSVVTTTNED